MIRPTVHTADVTRYGSERSGGTGAVAVLAAGWVLVLGALAGTVLVIAKLSWSQELVVIVLCGSLPFAMWMTRRVIASRRLRSMVPSGVLAQRYYGNPEAATDSEYRPLRPIGTPSQEIMTSTAAMLAELTVHPCVRIFHDVRPAGASMTSIPHAISAGKKLILIESVAWPPGRYETGTNGQVYCDGIYIGQSVRPLTASVHRWQGLLPKNHCVSAIIVVYTDVKDRMRLPAAAGGLSWIFADDALCGILRYIQCGHQSVSRNVVAALVSAVPGRV